MQDSFCVVIADVCGEYRDFAPLQTKSFRQLVQLTEPKLTPPQYFPLVGFYFALN